MKIGLAVSYLNSELEIPRALDPWYPKVDHIIAVDGRYKTPLTPTMHKNRSPNYSTDNSYEVLEKRYGDKLVYDKLFDTQIAKRNKCFEIAAELGCDIVITWDTDDIIHPNPDYQDWNKFFKQITVMLEHFPEEYTFKMWAWIPSTKDWSPQHNAVPPNTWIKYDRIHKEPENLKYINSHYTWTTKDITNKEINEWKWAHPEASYIDNPYFKQGNTIIDGIRITTDRKFRTPDQLTYGDNWAWQNMHWEAYEYDIKPYWENKGFALVYEALKAKYPERDMRYYFSSEDNAKLIPYYIDKKGRYVIIKPDFTEEILTV